MGYTSTEIEGFKRLSGLTPQGQVGRATAVVAGDWTFSAGFGATASAAITANSTDMRGRATFTSAGAGQGASPTATLTFKDGAFPAAPIAIVCRGGGDQPTIDFSVTTINTTTMVLTFNGTPIAAETYTLNWFVIG